MAAEEGTHSPASSVNEGMEKEQQEVGENEEFYETIEAPKFVDFTVPDHHCPDDRFWFCLRVGCDQKHEEEMDSEAIYKNFVLRVMAARSPNVRLHKALNRNCSSKTMKCPLSAPPKSSKSRLSRLAAISSISLKKDDTKERVNKPLSKLCSTPKAKGKQVAAKYLTTPRNKKCIQNPNDFRSVQNTKPPGVVVPKNRTVAKTLTFPSPKKAFNLKTSVELRTPLTKLCQKMKKLEITSQRKAPPSKQSKQFGSHSQKSLPVFSSARQKSSNNDKCGRKISQKLITRLGKQEAKSSKGKSMGKLSKQTSTKAVYRANETDAESRDDPIKEEAACGISNGQSSDASASEFNTSSNSPQTSMAADDIPTLQTSIREDDDSQEKVQESSVGITEVSLGCQQNSDKVLPEYAIPLDKGCESETTHNDDKENATDFDENRSCSHNNDHSGRNILGTQNSDRKKGAEAVDKDWKGQATNGAPGLKLMKLKPTNPKPFKLRTDERGILREANLERKNHAIAPQKEAALVSKCEGRSLRGQHPEAQKGIVGLKPTKKEVKTKTPTGHKENHSKQEEMKPRSPTCESSTRQKLEHLSKKKNSSSAHGLHQPQRQLHVTSEAMTPDKTNHGTVNNSSSGNSTPKEIGRQCKKVHRVPAGSPGSLSWGRRTGTIPREPNFHRFHMPKSCAGKTS